jgi:hypothetical protein
MLARVLGVPAILLHALARVDVPKDQQQKTSDGILGAIDMFKSAALLARERDLQAEAQALSRLGHTYKVCARHSVWGGWGWGLGPNPRGVCDSRWRW